MYIGTAGWTIPGPLRSEFAADGSQLERYAARLASVEVNSTFYRSHRPTTYARWAATVPATFMFCLKVPKEISHVRRLIDCADILEQFLHETAELGAKRRVLLLQLPPSFAYDDVVAGRFFELFRRYYDGFAVCEPRHPTWFDPPADAALRAYQIGRAAADPAVCDAASRPGGWPAIAYYRQHGSPRTYYSDYEPVAIAALAESLTASAAPERWCIFDNTAAGAALGNALETIAAVARRGVSIPQTIRRMRETHATVKLP